MDLRSFILYLTMGAPMIRCTNQLRSQEPTGAQRGYWSGSRYVECVVAVREAANNVGIYLYTHKLAD